MKKDTETEAKISSAAPVVSREGKTASEASCPNCGEVRTALAEQCPKCHLVYRKFKPRAGAATAGGKATPIRRCVKCDAIIAREAASCPGCKAENRLEAPVGATDSFSWGAFLRENARLTAALVFALALCAYYYADKYGPPAARASGEVETASAVAGTRIRQLFHRPDTVVLSAEGTSLENQGWGDYLLTNVATAENTTGVKATVTIVSRMKRTESGWEYAQLAAINGVTQEWGGFDQSKFPS